MLDFEIIEYEVLAKMVRIDIIEENNFSVDGKDTKKQRTLIPKKLFDCLYTDVINNNGIELKEKTPEFIYAMLLGGKDTERKNELRKKFNLDSMSKVKIIVDAINSHQIDALLYGKGERTESLKDNYFHILSLMYEKDKYKTPNMILNEFKGTEKYMQIQLDYPYIDEILLAWADRENKILDEKDSIFRMIMKKNMLIDDIKKMVSKINSKELKELNETE